MHLLVILLQHLLGRLLDKPQLQPELVRPRQQGPSDETAECRGFLYDTIGWLTVLFAAAPTVFSTVAPRAAPSFARSDSDSFRSGACRAGGAAPHTSSFLSYSRRTLRISSQLRS